MMWVLRAGKKAKYYDDFKEYGRIFICWNGYEADLSTFSEHNQFLELASRAKENTSIVAIRNRGSQLEYFTNEMNIGDLILIPSYRSKYYTLVKVIGPYEFSAIKDYFPHSRRVKFLITGIDRNIFSQRIQYSLGAYRTLFHAKEEEYILSMIKKNISSKETR